MIPQDFAGVLEPCAELCHRVVFNQVGWIICGHSQHTDVVANSERLRVGLTVAHQNPERAIRALEQIKEQVEHAIVSY